MAGAMMHTENGCRDESFSGAIFKCEHLPNCPWTHCHPWIGLDRARLTRLGVDWDHSQTLLNLRGAFIVDACVPRSWLCLSIALRFK